MVHTAQGIWFTRRRTINNSIRKFSHAEGESTLASGSCFTRRREYLTTATGSHSHAEGLETIAQGEASHAEGAGTKAQGDGSHAEGDTTTASG
jgi:trimeric autotransporter adhesin